MDKLKIYLDTKTSLKNEFSDYGSEYFYNVESFYCKAIFVQIHYDGNPETIRKTVMDFEKVKKYCKRYGYTLENAKSVPGYTWYRIFKTSELETLLYYQHYVNLSVAECEKAIHENHINPVLSDRELNNKIRAIMDFYGNNLKAFFNSIAT